MQRVNVEEASRRLPDLIDAVLQGEIIPIFANDHQTFASLQPRHPRKSHRPGNANG